LPRKPARIDVQLKRGSTYTRGPCELRQLIECRQLLSSGETDTVQVLDERQLQSLDVGGFPLDRPDRTYPCPLVGPPAAFATDQHETSGLVVGPNDDWLELATGANRRSQLLERPLVELTPWTVWVRTDAVDREQVVVARTFDRWTLGGRELSRAPG